MANEAERRMSKPIYLDYNATTPVAPEVADAIEPFLREHFGNPSSSHVYGLRARGRRRAAFRGRDDDQG